MDNFTSLAVLGPPSRFMEDHPLPPSFPLPLT